MLNEMKSYRKREKLNLNPENFLRFGLICVIRLSVLRQGGARWLLGLIEYLDQSLTPVLASGQVDPNTGYSRTRKFSINIVPTCLIRLYPDFSGHPVLLNILSTPPPLPPTHCYLFIYHINDSIMY